MVILYPGSLPPGALIDDSFALPVAAKPVAGLPPPAPLWFTTTVPETIALNDTGRMQRWSALGLPDWHSTPLEFNKDGTDWDASARLLRFHAKTHSGFVLPPVLSRGDRFSVGLIYHPVTKGSAMTVLSLQTIDTDSYCFMSCWNGVIRFGVKDREDTMELPEPSGVNLLILSSDGVRVKMAVNRGLAVSIDHALPALPQDVFIGARGAARSLVNKLGNFGLSDVMIWPDRDVLAEDRAPAEALAQWQERQHHGS